MAYPGYQPPPPGYGYQQPPVAGYQPPPQGGPIVRAKRYYYYLTSCLNGLVISVPEGSTEPTRVCTAPKKPVKNANNQLWFLDDAGEGYYYIVSKLKPDDTLVLDIEGRSTENDARVKTSHRKPEHKSRQDRANQMWRVDPDGTIVSALHGKVMDVKGRNTAPGTPIVMFGKKAAHDRPQNQQWRLEPAQ